MSSTSDLLSKKKLLEDSWKPGYKYFSGVIKKYSLKIGAEIGVAFGGHAEAILKNTSVIKLYGLDPYKHLENYNDVCNFSQKEFDKLHLFTLKRLSVYKSRYTHIRKPSKEGIVDVPDNLDFVYIDADHSYEGVMEDLSLWFLKVRDNGIIGGHDYGHSNHPGVKQAVDKFFGRFNWRINVEGEGVWWVEKKQLNITFVIPAYNCQDNLAESVDSIFDGNFTKGDEVIIIDDASTDDTLKIAEKILKKYPPIRIYRHHYNKGSAAAGRNTGIDNSKNELIFCLDADNILYPKTISRLKKYLLSRNADIASFKELYFFTESKNKISHKMVFNDEIHFSDCLKDKKFPGASGNYLFTKQSWLKAGRYNESIGGAYDSWAFGFCQLATGSKMVTMPNSFYYHRHGYESTFVKEVKKINPSIAMLQIILPFIDLFDEEDADYIMSRRGRRTWFSNLEKHPLKLKPVNFTAPLSYKNMFLDRLKRVKRSLRIRLNR